MLKKDLTTLRAPEERDLAPLVELRNDIDLQLLLASRPRPNSTERVKAWIAGLTTDSAALFFVIAEGLSEACGYIQLSKIDEVNRTAQLGICVAVRAQGKGHAARALELTETYARDVFGVRKIILTVLDSNGRAVAFYRKSGYLDVGFHRQHFFLRGRYHDVLIMEKLLIESAAP